MAEFILMPKLGFNMESGQLAKWLKKEGEPVQKGEVIFEILTDKTTMAIESTLDGHLRKILVEEGETVAVILPIAIIGEADEDIGQMIKEAAEKLGKTGMADSANAPSVENLPAGAPRREAVPADAASDGKIKLTPKAARYIKENRIDVTNLDIKGTGFQGGITAADVEEYGKSHRGRITPLAEKIAAASNLNPGGVKGTGPAGKIMKADVEGAVGARGEQGRPPGDPLADRTVLKTIPYSGMRKIIGDRLSQSMFTAPHLYFTTSIDVANLMTLRQQANSSQEQKVSLNDFVAAAVTKALQKCPELNSSLQDNQIIQYEDVNLGIAVGLETGLIVPVIKKAQNKKVTQIARESQSLIDKARNGKLLPDEYKGGTFTISNLGMFGIENFTAIINPPEAGILSISAVKKTPVVVEDDGEDKILIKSVMHITLSVDHRIIDGLVATRFINQIKALLENPVSILI
ncbi:MAG: 2-oxo acid dehydrogenase subunit E2 [Deltaproteobacteria bacterium]|nr:2-oxo acid dehydrogenase subunit E2 [Deltaproteobacteria bacterium]